MKYGKLFFIQTGDFTANRIQSLISIIYPIYIVIYAAMNTSSKAERYSKEIKNKHFLYYEQAYCCMSDVRIDHKIMICQCKERNTPLYA